MRTTTATVATTLSASDYRVAVRAGALVVDIRSRAQRERQGVLAGAIAVEARPVVDLLDPSSPAPLAAVAKGRPVVLVSDVSSEIIISEHECYKTSKLFINPLCMENARTVFSLICVCTKIIALCLD